MSVEHSPPTVPQDTLAPWASGGASRLWRALHGALFAATWVYAAAVLTVLMLIRVIGERWWPVTLLLFCPRYVYLAPAVLLALASGLARRHRLLTTQTAIALVAAGPLMGFTAHVAWPGVPSNQGRRVRILTLNQHNGRARAGDLIRLIERYEVDVICLQEMVFDPALETYLSRGWYRDHGKCISSRFPIVHQYQPTVAPYDDPLIDMVRMRTRSGSEFVVASVHRPTMRPGFESIVTGGVAGLRRTIGVRRAAMVKLASDLNRAGTSPTILAGDFNTPGDSSLFDELRNRFHVGFERVGRGYGYTWPARCPGLRIDHVFSTKDCAFSYCVVGPGVGSDHLPVIAELRLPDANIFRNQAESKR